MFYQSDFWTSKTKAWRAVFADCKYSAPKNDQAGDLIFWT